MSSKYFLDKTGTTDKTDWLPFSVYNSTFLSPSNIILITLCLNFIGNTGEKVYFVWQTDGEFCPFPSLECFVWSADYRTGVLYKCLNWQLSQEITTKLFVESCNNLKRSLILLNVEPSLHLNSVFLGLLKKLCCIVLIYLEMEDSFNFFVILCSVSSFYFDINQFRLFRCKVEHNVSSTFQMTMLNVKSIKILWRNR